MTRGDDQRRVALGLGGAAFLLVAAAGMALAFLTAARLDRAMAPDRAGLIDTASGLVQQSLRRGLDHDLPLQDLPGIDAYLADLRSRLPGVSRIVLSLGAAEGATEFGAGESRATDRLEARVLDLPGQAVRVSFYSAPPQQPLSSLAMIGRVLGIAGLVGGLAGWLYYLTAGRTLSRAAQRLEGRLAALAAGDFRGGPPSPGSPVSGSPVLGNAVPGERALAALSARLEPLNLRHSLLQDHASGLRAIDHDGRLSAQVDQVMAGLPADWRFSDPDRGGRP